MKKKEIVRTAEKDLKNIRKMIGNSVREFSKSIGVSEKRLTEIEKGNEKLSDTELYIICSIIMNTINKLMIDNNSNDEVKNLRNIIVSKLGEYIGMYHPLNGQMRQKNDSGSATVVSAGEPINPNDQRFKKRNYARKLK